MIKKLTVFSFSAGKKEAVLSPPALGERSSLQRVIDLHCGREGGEQKSSTAARRESMLVFVKTGEKRKL